jgi:isocitrate lyase
MSSESVEPGNNRASHGTHIYDDTVRQTESFEMCRVRFLSSKASLTQISRSLMSSAYARPTALALDPPTPLEESDALASRIAAVETFFSQPRFSGLSRPYSAAAVASKQGTLPPLPLPSTLLADKLYVVFDRAAKERKPVHTLGAVDPVQMTQMARWLEVVYVSGWAASSLLTTANNEVGPDLG